MITSIVLKRCCKIGMNSSRKIEVNGTVLSVDKDIPFVRYRFDSYGDEEFNYIKQTMEQFKVSTHLVEINLEHEESARVLRYLRDNNFKLARYIYINITDEDVQRGLLSQNVIDTLREILEFNVDRIMLRDKSSTLDAMAFKHFCKQIVTALGVRTELIGVCSSPLSFGESACLTAVKARELMSLYSTTTDVALPSANHQCMNCCGCIRYMTVSEDTLAPADGKTKGASKKKEGESGNSEKASKPKSKPSLTLVNFI